MSNKYVLASNYDVIQLWDTENKTRVWTREMRCSEIIVLNNSEILIEKNPPELVILNVHTMEERGIELGISLQQGERGVVRDNMLFCPDGDTAIVVIDLKDLKIVRKFSAESSFGCTVW